MAIGTISNGETGSSVRTKLNLVIAKINKYFDIATDNRVVRTDGTTGGTQESSVTIDDNGTVNIPSGQNYQIDGVSLPKSSEVILKSAYTPAYSLLAQQSGTGNPSVVTVANDRILGRKSGGGDGIEGLTASEAKTILALNNVDNTSDATKNAATATLTNKTLTTPVIAEISGVTIAAAPTRDVSVSATLASGNRGHFNIVDSSGGAIVMTVNDTSEAAFAASFGEANFFALDATNPITFVAGGSQTIISANGDLEMDGTGALVGIKYLGSNTWALVGKLKA